jgi:hypothetical protein
VLLNQGGTTEASFVLAIERGFFIAMTNDQMKNDKGPMNSALPLVI